MRPRDALSSLLGADRQSPRVEVRCVDDETREDKEVAVQVQQTKAHAMRSHDTEEVLFG